MNTVYAFMKWGSVDDSLSIDTLPEQIVQAKSLWEQKKGEDIEGICALIQPFISCQLVAENFSGWEEYFDCSDYGEFVAKTIKVTGVDFSEGLLPSITAEAWIDVALVGNKTSSDVDEWMEEIDDTLGWGVSFWWEFDAADDNDLTMVDHRGLDAVWLSA